MEQHEFEKLLDKYNNGEASSDERALVESWYLKHQPYRSEPPHQQLEEDKAESLYLLLDQIKISRRKLYWPRVAAAASILLFMAAGMYFLKFKKVPDANQKLTKIQIQHDVAPGGNKATLTLANGATIVLTGAQNGRLANQGNTVINKTADGKISYEHDNKGADQQALAYNTAATPRGGQFQFVLSDGTKVWLNSASSIKYPVEFVGNERKVELTGEAYFEVVHNEKKPFSVISNGQVVEVLGTHFNINSYSDEGATKTTLLQGRVKVTSTAGSNIIQPGQQAQLIADKLTVSNVDADDAVAWKNGLFNFKDDNIEAVMRQLARWYDVDVKYEGKVPARVFSGEISRNVNASQILEILSFKKIHFKIEGKTITVMP